MEVEGFEESEFVLEDGSIDVDPMHTSILEVEETHKEEAYLEISLAKPTLDLISSKADK